MDQTQVDIGSMLQDLDGQISRVVSLSTPIEWVKSTVPTISPLLSSDKSDDRVLSMAPDLNTCHASLSDADRPVSCCPPKRESEETVIDFQFPSPSDPVRVRRPAHLVDPEYVAKYHEALTLMRNLHYTHPHSFKRQADMHCIYCTGAYNQLNSSALLKIHRSWLFFPWHRMMIYFHERILGKLLGDHSFALPYWNWDAPPGMVIPGFYVNGSFVDDNRDRSHLPPEVADVNYNVKHGRVAPEDQIKVNLAFMYNQMVSGARKTELFMGCFNTAGEEGACNGPGTIEAAPHNTLHTWVGSNLNPEREDMGAFYSAARDPIFYAHHANIDRLWDVWRELQGGNLDIASPAWLETHFYFHDENERLVRIKIRDVLNSGKLGYRYEDTDLPWLRARPRPSIPPRMARHILKTTEKKNGLRSSARLVAGFGSQGQTLDTIVRAKIMRPKWGRSKKDAEEEEEVLVVYGINVKKDMYAKFDVFINAVNETALGPESREFVGSFVNVRKGVRIVLKEGDSEKPQQKTTLKLGISEALEDLEAEEEESIWVSLVPRGGTGANTTVDGIRIQYIR
ncbi:hypothetical protein ACLOJK_001791 [Asimina triloba]